MGLTKKDKQFISQILNQSLCELKNELYVNMSAMETRLNSSINALKIYMETYFSKIDNHEIRILRLEDMNRKKTS